jgi:hypothetical protein
MNIFRKIKDWWRRKRHPKIGWYIDPEVGIVILNKDAVARVAIETEKTDQE